jgi:hypothetical protein
MIVPDHVCGEDLLRLQLTLHVLGFVDTRDWIEPGQVKVQNVIKIENFSSLQALLVLACHGTAKDAEGADLEHFLLRKRGANCGNEAHTR